MQSTRILPFGLYNWMLYICDPSDSRQASRSRLYRLWYEAYEKHEEFTLSDKAIGLEGVTIYARLLIKNNNPAYNLIIEAFNDFVNLIPYDNSFIEK